MLPGGMEVSALWLALGLYAAQYTGSFGCFPILRADVQGDLLRACMGVVQHDSPHDGHKVSSLFGQGFPLGPLEQPHVQERRRILFSFP